MRQLPPITLTHSARDRLNTLIDNAREDNPVYEQLLDELERADIVADALLPDDVVAVGSRLRFRNLDSGHEHDIQLVWPQEVGHSAHAVSVLTPAGAALIGLRVGSEIDWPGPAGLLRLQLLSVS